MAPQYDLKVQAWLVSALCALHNFILDNDPHEHIDPSIEDPIPGAHVDAAELWATQGEISTNR